MLHCLLDELGSDVDLDAVAQRPSEARVLAGAYVVGGEGFAASAKRSVLTAMSLVGSGAPRRAFSEPSAAALWLAGELGCDASALAAAAEWCERELRSA